MKKRVFIGLSGGVDSSVSAALLKEQGYDVTGVFIKVWHPDFLPCPWKEERRDAMRVCAQLDIPFLTFDFEEEYKKGVVDYMIAEYKAGRTPNPDVMCNKYVKFGSFLNKALDMGADYIATGHYAQVKENNGEFVLLESPDKAKDQSYFLWTLGQKELSHTLFPVGHLHKTEVRKLAEKFGLPTATKKDSQGLCFIGKVDIKDFLKHYIDAKEGNVLDVTGKVIGTHDGVYFYTIGQRHGFTITKKGTDDAPLFVVAKDISNNTITVSEKFQNISETFNAKKVALRDIHWTSGKARDVGEKCLARFRYHQDPQECVISDEGITFAHSQSTVSLGQSLVLYKGEECLGGGIIDSIK